MKKLASYFGNPQDDIKVLHIAGTNGKGSVSLKVAEGLKLMGLTTGLFTSPHIETFRERIQVNQVMASKESLNRHFESIFSCIEANSLDTRFFEIILMAAWLEFREKQCEYAVVECGIGGKKDSTIFIDHPIASAITSIGHDHMDLLGNSLEEIAADKAHVIKAGTPCVLGPSCRPMKSIEKRIKLV